MPKYVILDVCKRILFGYIQNICWTPLYGRDAALSIGFTGRENKGHRNLCIINIGQGTPLMTSFCTCKTMVSAVTQNTLLGMTPIGRGSDVPEWRGQ